MIRTPLPYIAMHIMQSPRIGGEAGYIRRLPPVFSSFAFPKHTIAIVISQLRADRGAVMKWRGGARSAGVFPLGFTRQGVKQFLISEKAPQPPEKRLEWYMCTTQRPHGNESNPVPAWTFS